MHKAVAIEVVGPGRTYRLRPVDTAAEKTGGAEYYLIEQEGSRFTPFDTLEKCLANFRKLRPTT